MAFGIFFMKTACLVTFFCGIYVANARPNRVVREAVAENPCGVNTEAGPSVTTELYSNTVNNIYLSGHQMAERSEEIKSWTSASYNLQPFVIGWLDGQTILDVTSNIDKEGLNPAGQEPVMTLTDTYNLAYTLLVNIKALVADGSEIGDSPEDTDVELKGKLEKLEENLLQLMCNVHVGLSSQNAELPELEAVEDLVGDIDLPAAFHAYVLMADSVKVGLRTANIYSAISESLP